MRFFFWTIAIFLAIGASRSFTPRAVNKNGYKPCLSFVPAHKSCTRRQGTTRFVLRASSHENGGPKKTPFFARLFNRNKENELEAQKEKLSVVVEDPPKSLTDTKHVPSPQENYARLKAQAEKIRLQAERLDVELTLSKIAKLEKEIGNVKKHSNKTGAEKRLEQLMRDVETLRMKLRGETPKPIVPTAPETSLSNTPTGTFSDTTLASITTPFDREKFEFMLDTVNGLPEFAIKKLAAAAGIDCSDGAVNRTECAIRFDQQSRLDFSYVNKARPVFTREQIQARIEGLSNGTYRNYAFQSMQPYVANTATMNETQIALLSLEYEYYSFSPDINVGQKIDDLLQPFAEMMMNMNDTETALDIFFPDCTRQQSPTLADAEKLFANVLPAAGWISNGRPEAVAGGYIIRGRTKKNGNELIDAIDAGLETCGLQNSVTVIYGFDYSTILDEEDIELTNAPPVLYVLGPSIVRAPKPVPLSIVTACGIATTWYLSLYPFLLNPAILQRVQDELALVGSGSSELSWLTDLSIPIFYTFFGIQLLHDASHQIVAKAKGIKLTVPTFVPSLTTGITSSVMTFKQPVKNRNDMFDISVAGPLTGMVASIIALVIGSQLTLTSDASMLPSLSLSILTQSALGGGIINLILGNILFVPQSSLAAEMTVPLHPIAIAGFFSLIVNSLALVPIGTTDGGRIVQSIFGRPAKQSIGFAALVALLVLGISGSTIFLSYFAFVVAFQLGSEVPERNEYDSVSFERVLLMTATFVMALLTLNPFQTQ